MLLYTRPAAVLTSHVLNSRDQPFPRPWKIINQRLKPSPSVLNKSTNAFSKPLFTYRKILIADGCTEKFIHPGTKDAKDGLGITHQHGTVLLQPPLHIVHSRLTGCQGHSCRSFEPLTVTVMQMQLSLLG